MDSITTVAEYEASIAKMETFEAKTRMNDSDYFNFGMLAGMILKWEYEHGRGGEDSAINDIVHNVMGR